MRTLQEHYAGKSILVTGATGFLAKALVAKILGDLDVERVFVLLRDRPRARRGATDVAERLRREVLGTSAFRALRTRLGGRFQERVAARLTALRGDVGLPGLGLSRDDRMALEGIDGIVHSAATVEFDAPLDLSVRINTLGAGRVLELARELRDVPLLHVSTAYTCGRLEGLVLEAPPEPDRSVADLLAGDDRATLDLDEEIARCGRTTEEIEARSREPEVREVIARDERRSDESPEDARRRHVEAELRDAGMARARELGWHDTYTFTKALGERLIVREGAGRRVAILRPAIIESSLREPEPGWIDVLRMADPLFVGYAKGVVRELPADADSVIDFIPVDHVVNASLAALARLWESGSGAGEIPVYHVATSGANPLRFGRLADIVREYFHDHPLRDREGRPLRAKAELLGQVEFERRMRRRTAWLKTVRPLVRRLPGRLRSRWQHATALALRQLDRVMYYARIYGPYCNFPARFSTRRTEDLLAALDPADRSRFGFDPRSFSWREYLAEIHLPGLLRNVLREDAPSPLSVDDASARGAERGSLLGLMRTAATTHEGRPALRRIAAGGERTWTHGEVWQTVLAAADRLRSLGVKPGDAVVLQAESSPSWVMGYFGILACGATAVPLEAGASPEAAARAARRVEASHAICSAAVRERLGARADRELVALEDLTGGRLSEADAARRGLPVDVSPEAPASILFTSGTTLEPKGVELSHRAFRANVESITAVLRPTPEDRILSVLPLHHAFEFTAGLLAPLSVGASVTYLEELNGPAIVAALGRIRATVMLGVPRLFELLLEGMEREIERRDRLSSAVLRVLRSTAAASASLGGPGPRVWLAPLHRRFGGHLRALVCGGAALDPRVGDALVRLGFPLVEGYGLTEAAPVVCVNPPDAPRPGTVGPALPGIELRVDRPDPSGVGEVLVRGTNLMSGYHGDPEATRAALVDGWLRTGDLGRLDEQGYLEIKGRSKDVIVTNAGKNVHPDEVEEALGPLDGVVEACIVGARARGGHGEEVHLVVVPEARDEETWRGIRAQVAERVGHLPPHARIQRIHFWDGELPKTPLKKVQRGRVREHLEGVAPEEPTSERALARVDGPAGALLDLLARLARVPRTSLRADQHLSLDLGVDSLMRAELAASIASAGSDAEAVEEATTVGELLELVGEAGPPRVRPRKAASAAAPGAERSGSRALARTAAPLIRAAWPVFYGRYLNLTVEGRANLPEGEPYILAANHQSHLDAGAVLTALGATAQRLHVVAARDYFFDTPLKETFFGALLNAIPFDRHGDAGPGLEACRRALRAGDPLLIFPEGTRSLDGRLQEFKPGVGLLAVELSVPIVPTRIEGTHAALPKGARIPRRHPVSVLFGTPVRPGSADVDDSELVAYERYRRIVEVVRKRVAALEPGRPSAATA